MTSVRQYYESDFPGFIGPEGPVPIGPNGVPFEPPVMYKVLYNFESGAECVAFYIPVEAAGINACLALLENFGWLEEGPMKLKMQLGFAGENHFDDLSECVFTRRVAIYVEGYLAPHEVAVLQGVAASHKLSVIVRDKAYGERRDARELPHAFVSHDWQDKTTIAKPLATMLSQNLCRVWYDEFSLRVGDSLRAKIEEGLRTCRRCILILTPHFLTNGGWGRREYDSIFTREIVEKQNLILPVWAGVTRNEIFQYSPVLADRVAVSWERGIDYVGRELLKVLL